MKTLFILHLCLGVLSTSAQTTDSLVAPQGACLNRGTVTGWAEKARPAGHNNVPMEKQHGTGSWTTDGVIDLMQSGRVNASARLFRLMMGEKGKFEIPVSLYSGVSANALNSRVSQNELGLLMLNPGFGLLNLCAEGTIENGVGEHSISRLVAGYCMAGRIFGLQPGIGYENEYFFNMVGSVGATLMTGVRNPESLKEGMCWLSAALFTVCNSRKTVEKLFRDEINRLMFAWSAGFGVSIPGLFKTRLSYYRYVGQELSGLFERPAIQLSFNYGIQ